MKHLRQAVMLTVMLSLVLMLGPVWAHADNAVLARIEVNGSVEALNLPIYAHLQDAAGRDYALVITPSAQLDKSGLTYEILDFCDYRLDDEIYFIALERRQGARQQASAKFEVLHDDGKQLIVCSTMGKVEELSMLGFDLDAISTPLVFKSPKVEVLGITHNPKIAEMIGQVQSTALKQYVANLSGEAAVNVGGTPYTIVSRNTSSGQPITKATQYTYEFMQKLGFTVSYHDWSSWSTTCRNVIGTKLGTTKPKEIVLVTGHLDSMPSSATNSPGADDNGSGSAGILLAAEIVSKYQFERTIRFALFTGEEQGLLGSKAYADKVAQDGETLVAVCNLDMIAWDSTGGPTLRLHVRTTSNSGYAADKAIADLFGEVVKTYQIALTPILDADGITASDHSSFWRKGYAAMLAIEDDEDDFCANYHTNRDKLSTLNLNYFTNFVKATLGTACHLAGPVQ